MSTSKDEPVSFRIHAIARHVWAIASYIRGATPDPSARERMARNVARAVERSVDVQLDLGLPTDHGFPPE